MCILKQMGRHDDAVRAIERYRGAWPMDERLQESLDNMLLDLYKHSRDLGAFSSITLVPVRPRWRGERRSLRTLFPGASLRPGSLAFNPDAHTSTPFNSASDAFQLHPDVRRFERWNDPQTDRSKSPEISSRTR